MSAYTRTIRNIADEMVQLASHMYEGEARGLDSLPTGESNVFILMASAAYELSTKRGVG